MTAKQHQVCLTSEHRADLGRLLTRTGATAHQQRRARILLQADTSGDGPHLTDVEVAAAVLCSARTVARTRSDYAAGGIERALARQPRSDRRPRKLEGEPEARLIALACGEPPAGHARWSLRQLSATLMELAIVETVSPETVRLALKKTACAHG